MELFGSDMILFISDMILLVSIFQVHELSVLLVAVLINFGVKNQVPKISFKIYVGDLMSVFLYEFDDIIFYAYFYILEIISYFMIFPFTLIDLELPRNSNMIECTNTQSFEEGENCASTISVEHTLVSDMKLFVSNMILFLSNIILLVSCFNFQELPLMLVYGLIKFGVKNEVPQFSFEVVAG